MRYESAGALCTCTFVVHGQCVDDIVIDIVLGHLFKIELNSNVSLSAGRPFRLRYLRRAELSTDD